MKICPVPGLKLPLYADLSWLRMPGYRRSLTTVLKSAQLRFTLEYSQNSKRKREDSPQNGHMFIFGAE
jgi:hypothetical protein